MASVAVPNFTMSRDNAQASICTEIRQGYYEAKETWKIDNAMVISDNVQRKDVVPEHTESFTNCLSNGEYTLRSLSENTHCSNCSVHGSSFNTSNIAWYWIVDLLD